MFNKKFIKSRKGTAEVIGTMMFIVILLFFFTNVYLWHDAATKDANQLNLKQINAIFSITQPQNGVPTIQVTAGGSQIVLSRLWIVDANGNHLYTNLNGLNGINVKAGMSQSINLKDPSLYYTNPLDNTTVNGNNVTPSSCWVINTLGIIESWTIQ